MKKLAILLIIFIFIFLSILYYFNFTIDYIQTFVWTADWFWELYNITMWNLTTHTNYVLYILSQFFDIKYWLYIYNLLSVVFLLSSVYLYLRNKWKIQLFVIFCVLLLFNSYVFIFLHEIDKPLYVALYLFSSIFFILNYFDNKKKAYLILFILSFIISIFSYISAIFFVPIIFLTYVIYNDIKIFTKKNIIYLLIITILWLIVLYFLSKNILVISKSLYWIQSVFLWWNIDNITWLWYLKALSWYLWLELYLFIFILIIWWFFIKDKDDKKLYLIFFISICYITFLFSIQSQSYSTGSRYPFYSILFAIYLLSLLCYNILLMHKTFIIWFLAILFININWIYPYNYYFRWLWNTHYNFCEYVKENVYNSRIAYLDWPSINFYCGISNSVDSNKNIYHNYWWTKKNLNEIKNGIDNMSYDYIVLDYNGDDYIKSAQEIRNYLKFNTKYYILNRFDQLNPQNNIKYNKIEIYQLHY